MLARVNTQLRVKHMTDQLRFAAATDALTGVANRRKFDESLEHEWQRARRGADPMALLLIDVDHFKLFNDRYGHPKGDTSLRLVAKALINAARRVGDLVARCGGEEFALLLPQTSRLGAEYVARRVLNSIAALDIVHAGSPTAPHLTVSIGISCYDEESPCWVDTAAHVPFMGEDRRLPCTAADLVVTADKALYAAKRGGRGQYRLQDITGVEMPEPPGSTIARAPAMRKAG
jgi:diguanylate cyclase (GGDEF)-like protein